MNWKITFTSLSLFLIQCNHPNKLPVIELDNNYRIESDEKQNFKEFGVITSFYIIKEKDTVYYYDNVDEFKLDDLNPLVFPKDNNGIDFLFTVSSPPAKPYMCKLNIINDSVTGITYTPQFESEAKNLDEDKELELAGYWSWFELWGDDNNPVTSYNPIIYYAITKQGLDLDSLLTIQKNTEIFGHFYGYKFSEIYEQPSSVLELFSDEIERIKSN